MVSPTWVAGKCWAVWTAEARRGFKCWCFSGELQAYSWWRSGRRKEAKPLRRWVSRLGEPQCKTKGPSVGKAAWQVGPFQKGSSREEPQNGKKRRKLSACLLPSVSWYKLNQKPLLILRLILTRTTEGLLMDSFFKCIPTGNKMMPIIGCFCQLALHMCVLYKKEKGYRIERYRKSQRIIQ